LFVSGNERTYIRNNCNKNLVGPVIRILQP
jgi:hypothetical protein